MLSKLYFVLYTSAVWRFADTPLCSAAQLYRLEPSIWNRRDPSAEERLKLMKPLLSSDPYKRARKVTLDRLDARVGDWVESMAQGALGQDIKTQDSTTRGIAY